MRSAVRSGRIYKYYCFFFFTECSTYMKFCSETISCEYSLTSDEECCGAEGQFCLKTEKCESKASFVQDCGGYLVVITTVYSYVDTVVCPSGLKYCNLTEECQPSTVDHALCCGVGDKFCFLTNQCQDGDSFVQECGQYISSLCAA